MTMCDSTRKSQYFLNGIYLTFHLGLSLISRSSRLSSSSVPAVLSMHKTCIIWYLHPLLALKMAVWDVSLSELESSFAPKESGDLFNTRIPAVNKRCCEEEAPVIEEKRPRKKPTKFSTYTLSSGEGCLHEVVYPAGEQMKRLVPIVKPAKEYPFTLDSFQKQAVLCIENNQSVLVSAHTSAGKTVVAEYAVAKCLQKRQRVIYTTPIKALSNQKFREFTEEFKDVGLMTGDITINPEATVLIMTTEILRLMLYRGSEVTREVGWVIFDEIHYMREKERGVVWEETIILLPDSVGMVFLSATIPNARQFAEWIVFLHKQPCNVVYTDYRPVPLQHYVYPCGGDGIHLVVNQKRDFLEENFNTAMKILQKAAGNAEGDMQMRGRRGGSTRGKSYCKTLVSLVMNQNLEPLIVFSFSKVECEFYATQLSKMDFNTHTEKNAVELIFNNAIDSLSAEDKKLPQVQVLLPVLRRGVGIHHGGLLPILKEIVEILFAEGLIKVLFATETFAMGLNMPARTVLFTATRKFDGRDFRLISPGEYIQMSGRAGRRGKDDRGTVILMLDSRISASEARQLLMGQPDPLNSAFYLTNNMVLNLLRVEDINPELMLEKSFYQFQSGSQLSSVDASIKTLEAELKLIQFPDDVDLEQLGAYVKLQEALRVVERDRWSRVLRAKSVVPFLQAGRVVRIQTLDDIDYGWAVVVHINQPRRSSSKDSNTSWSRQTTIDCLMEIMPSSLTDTSPGEEPGKKFGKPIPLSMVEPTSLRLAGESDCGAEEFQSCKSEKLSPPKTVVCLVSVPISCLADLSSVCLKVKNMVECASGSTSVLSARLAEQPESVRRRMWEGIERAKQTLKGPLPLLDPIKDMQIRDDELQKLTEMMHMLKARMDLNPISKRRDCESLVDLYISRSTKLHELSVNRKRLQRQDNILLIDELRARKRLLRRLGFCSEDDVIALKGRVACEISSGDELMLTELLLDGLFSNLSAVQVAAVLSCFVVEHQPARTSTVDLQPDMASALKTVQSIRQPHNRFSFAIKFASRRKTEYRKCTPFILSIHDLFLSSTGKYVLNIHPTYFTGRQKLGFWRVPQLNVVLGQPVQSVTKRTVSRISQKLVLC
ncbi:unnamed protein product [Calicophoron daubneyi]|uniref:Superkiller viralicidic activity 2-like 2 n=1 Tax=Calicophoron daubneyi TaxID=300641 RepID=A0AAV2T471_CALDB